MDGTELIGGIETFASYVLGLRKGGLRTVFLELDGGKHRVVPASVDTDTKSLPPLCASGGPSNLGTLEVHG